MKKTLIMLLLLTPSAIFAQAVKGHFTLNYKHIQPMSENGTPLHAIAKHGACGWHYSKMLNKALNVSYSIDPVSKIETATAIFNGQSITLYPQGILENYQFMSDGTGALEKEGISRINITISHNFKPISASLVAKMKHYNCFLTT